MFRDGTESWRDANGTDVFVNPARGNREADQAASFRAELYDPRDPRRLRLENPQAIYKWIAGKSLPSLDNFIILSRLLHTSIENILVIDGDIPHLWGGLNQRFNDIFLLPPYNRVIRN